MRPDQPILIVDDDQVDVITLKRAIHDVGLTNILPHADNGEEALRFLRDHKNRLPSLILLDLNMPIMNGIEFMKEVKSDETLKIIPVVVLTTSKDEMDKLDSFKNGAAGYMIKPVDYNQFVELLRVIVSYWSTSELPSQ